MLFNIILRNHISKVGGLMFRSMYSEAPNAMITSENIRTVNLAYADYNDFRTSSQKPPIVIIHAMFDSKDNWNFMGKAINRTSGRRVICVDARNHGVSERSPQHTYYHMAHDVIELLKKLKLTKVTILGHCMGGYTAMVLAFIRPNLVSRLVVEDVSPFNITPYKDLIIHLLDILDTMSIKPNVSLSKAKEIAHELLKPATSNVIIRNYIIDNLVQTKDGTFTWKINVPVLKKVFSSNIINLPIGVKDLQYAGPTVFIGGNLSGHIRKDELPKIKGYFPSAKLIFVDGAGHWVHGDKPQKYLEILHQFLEEDNDYKQ